MSEPGRGEGPVVAAGTDEVRARVEATRARFGERISPDRERLIERIAGNAVEASRHLRGVAFANHEEPEISFVPAPVDTPPVGDALAFTDGNAPNGDGYRYATIVELAGRLRAGTVRAADLAARAVELLETEGRRLGAVVTVTGERARAEAAAADRRSGAEPAPSVLSGIPWAAKDLLATAGIPTTWGAAPLRDQTFDHDATVVARLTAAGATLAAKAAMVEIAGGFGYDQPDAALTGPGRNAWDPDAWAGGSSSGSGALVAAGCVPFTIGSETWGSILTPAAFNGVTGLRPTYGRVSRHGAMALAWTLDKIGPLARTAEDCAIVLSAIAGADPADPSASDLPVPAGLAGPPPGGFRLAVPKGATRGCQPEVAANFEAALDVLREFATVEEIELPDLPWDSATTVVVFAEAASAFEREVMDAAFMERLTAPEDRVGMLNSVTVPAIDYLAALRVRRRGARLLGERLAGYHGLVAPTLAAVAPPIGERFGAYFDERPGSGDAERFPDLNAAANLCGLPAVTVPDGFGERGLPTGIQVVGTPWAERVILSVAHAYQRRTDWHRAVPAFPRDGESASR